MKKKFPSEKKKWKVEVKEREYTGVNSQFVSEGIKSLKVPDVPLKRLYKVQNQTGAGGYGTIFVAKDLRKGQKVVIKKLDHHNHRAQRHNYSEIGIMALLQHSSIVTYYESLLVFNEKKNFDEAWIVMEFLEGGSLHDASSSLKLADKHNAYIAREMLKGIQYLHSQYLAHRDLKSSNVMIDISGRIKLIDFGLCVDMSRGPQDGILGSAYWIPPEMIKGDTHSYPVDIWSFGVCILELLLGTVPYDNNALKCMFKAATDGLTSCIPPDTSNQAKDFILQCLVIDPDKRKTATELLDHPWVQQDKLDEGIIEALDAVFVTNFLYNF